MNTSAERTGCSLSEGATWAALNLSESQQGAKGAEQAVMLSPPLSSPSVFFLTRSVPHEADWLLQPCWDSLCMHIEIFIYILVYTCVCVCACAHNFCGPATAEGQTPPYLEVAVH